MFTIWYWALISKRNFKIILYYIVQFKIDMVDLLQTEQYLMIL